jgi:thiamine biosynthesis lipoprotein ApbE
MTSLVIEFALSAVLAALLGVTIAYCWVLNKRIQLLQDSRSELAALLRHFDKSTTKASESIVALQEASKKIGETIQGRIEKANFLIDDLNFIMERADKLADELEGLTSPAMKRTPSHPVLQSTRQEDVQEAKRAIASAISKESERHDAPVKSRAMSSLEAMLKKVADRPKEVSVTSKKSPILEEDRIPSRVEKELLEILKTTKV